MLHITLTFPEEGSLIRDAESDNIPNQVCFKHTQLSKASELVLDSGLLLSGTQLLFVASCHLPSGGQVLLLHMKLLPDIFCHHFPIK